MTTTPPPDLTGLVVGGRYRVDRLVGQGGMGTVWAGTHVTLGHAVAIKFVHPKLASSREALRRFENEAKAAARIKSRHAVAVFDHGVTPDGQPWIVMEFLEGESLERKLRRAGKLPLPEVTEIVSQVARALDVAHQAGVVHRDLKPDNVFLARDPEAGPGRTVVKVVDFGIAKLLHEPAEAGAHSTQAGQVLGTPHYMSPEALTGSGEVTPASDVWSLGACAYAALLGRPPFEGEAIGDVVLKVCAAPLPVPSRVDPSVPRPFDEWFSRCCARAPAARFGSAREAADALVALDRWAAEQSTGVAFELRPHQPSALELELGAERPPSRGRVLAGALAGVAVTVAVLGFYVKQRTDEANRTLERIQASALAAASAEEARRLALAARALEQRAASASASASASAAASADPRPPRRRP